MSLPDIFTFTLVAALLVMSPGPNGVLIAKTVPTSGRIAGFANVAGFVLAFYVHGTLSILGISFLLVQSAVAFSILKYLGAAYLVWIGVRSLISAFRDELEEKANTSAKNKRSLRRAFAEGFLTNALNPKVSMFYLAAFPQFVSVSDGSAFFAYLLVAIHSALNLVWFGGMVMLLDGLRGWTQSPTTLKALKLSIGAVFIGFGVKLASLNRI